MTRAEEMVGRLMDGRPSLAVPLVPVESRESFVYFIQEHPGGNIKIGVALDVEARCALLQIGNSRELRVVGMIPGSYETERKIHDEFESAWVRGEWFRPTAALLLLLRRLR